MKFICPECGSGDPEPVGVEEKLKRGRGLRHSITCARCHWKIPAHLAERWGDISIEAARQEWREIYRVVVFSEATENHLHPAGKNQSLVC